MRVSFTTQVSVLKLNHTRIDFAVNNSNGDVGKYLHKQGVRMVLAARRQVGVSSGRLRDSIHYRISRSPVGQSLIVGTRGVPYAIEHHEGTRPHLITPQRAQALRFSSGGRIVYARSVMHPGTKPNRFLSDQLRLIKL